MNIIGIDSLKCPTRITLSIRTIHNLNCRFKTEIKDLHKNIWVAPFVNLDGTVEYYIYLTNDPNKDNNTIIRKISYSEYQEVQKFLEHHEDFIPLLSKFNQPEEPIIPRIITNAIMGLEI